VVGIGVAFDVGVDVALDLAVAIAGCPSLRTTGFRKPR
jgi:hypothetical protein